MSQIQGEWRICKLDLKGRSRIRLETWTQQGHSRMVIFPHHAGWRIGGGVLHKMWGLTCFTEITGPYTCCTENMHALLSLANPEMKMPCSKTDLNPFCWEELLPWSLLFFFGSECFCPQFVCFCGNLIKKPLIRFPFQEVPFLCQKCSINTVNKCLGSVGVFYLPWKMEHYEGGHGVV